MARRAPRASSVPDFTSALYLGLRHASDELRPWAQLTTGAPAAVRRVPGAAAVARGLAALQGCDAATLVPSTLHGAWDLGGLVDAQREALHVDAEVYPILGAVALRARSRGVTVRGVAHHDAAALERSLSGDARRPVVLVDGLCPACGRPAPLGAYHAAVRRRGGLLVVDDTQAAGILGGPGGAVPAWGAGGGGSLRHHGLERAPDVLLLTSFAKALGAPVAALSGSAAIIDRYDAHADTRVHCSPVSVATVRALEHALSVNRSCGERLRHRAAHAVRCFRRGLRALGIEADGGVFCVQALPPLARPAAAALHRHLLDAGVRAVPQAWAGGAEGRSVFVLTARSRDADIDAALAAIAGAPQLASLRRARGRSLVVA
jgi:8-amino-7-oxononanoate synthase